MHFSRNEEENLDATLSLLVSFSDCWAVGTQLDIYVVFYTIDATHSRRKRDKNVNIVSISAWERRFP